MRDAQATLPLLTRLWIYQAERFPLAKHGLLIAVFAAAGVTLSAHLGSRPLPGLATYLVAAALTFLLFFQLRVSDEVKDADDDRRYRPERAVPRGLVTLGLLVRIALAAVGVQAAITLLFAPSLLWVLIGVWAWMGLMAAEFFAPHWLKARPLLYLASHMLVMPLIDLLVTATEWLPRAGAPPAGLVPFLILSFLNGTVLELGRKTWAPAAERDGVESYSRLWGHRHAAHAVMAAAVAAFLVIVVVGILARAALPVAAAGAVALALVLFAGGARRPRWHASRRSASMCRRGSC